jgi:hypothetical protein
MVVNRIYSQLDELRHLYGSESIEEVLAVVIARKKRLNRVVEQQGKAVVTDDEHQSKDPPRHKLYGYPKLPQ